MCHHYCFHPSTQTHRPVQSKIDLRDTHENVDGALQIHRRDRRTHGSTWIVHLLERKVFKAIIDQSRLPDQNHRLEPSPDCP